LEGKSPYRDTLNTRYDRPERYIVESLEPIIKFGKYQAFENGVVREFMMGAKRAGLLHWLINDQTLPNIMAWMPIC
jgi:hypothetical protein